MIFHGKSNAHAQKRRERKKRQQRQINIYVCDVYLNEQKSEFTRTNRCRCVRERSLARLTVDQSYFEWLHMYAYSPTNRVRFSSLSVRAFKLYSPLSLEHK